MSDTESDPHDTASIAQPDHVSHTASNYEADSSDSALDFVVGDDCFE